MIVRLSCKNFRSLENVQVPIGALTAFVGPNGSGKTSMLRAVDLLLGSTWPSLRSMRIPQDFTAFDSGREIVLELGFDPALLHEDRMANQHQIASLRLACAPYKRSGKWGQVGDLHVDFKALDEEGKVPSVAVSRPRVGKPPEFEPLSVSTGLRDQGRILFIDHRRSLSQHLPATRGSVLGRLFEPARKSFEADPANKARFEDQYRAAMEAIRTPRVREIEQTISETTKRMIGFLGSAAVENIDIGFGFADPANPFSSLRLIYREGDINIPGDELGLGIQSAMVVGIFEALRRLGGDVGTVVIEEPEMYLHPQAQRYFFRVLTDLADSGSCQVIYSTHSPIFADVSRFEAVRLVRKEPGAMTMVSYVSAPSDLTYLDKQRTKQKIGVGFDAIRSEVLFARRALLVEGAGDRIAAHLVAQKLGQDPDSEDVAIVSCGSKSSIPFFARTCRALSIPFVVLHDDDVYPVDPDPAVSAKQRQENDQASRVNAEIAKTVGESRLFVLSPSLEASLGISRRAADKPRRVIDELEGRDIDSVPRPLRQAVEMLFSTDLTTTVASSAVARDVGAASDR